MKWQPMPAMAREPSGTAVEVLCGQPEQNHGARSPRVDASSAASARSLASRIARCASMRARHVAVDAELAAGAGDGRGDQRRREVGLGAQQPVSPGLGGATRRRSRRPPLVELADHVGPHVGPPVVELFLQLVLDDLALFLDHQDLLAGLWRIRACPAPPAATPRRPCAGGCRCAGRSRRPGPGRAAPGACRCRPCRWR